MTSSLTDRVRTDGPRLEHVRSLIAATGPDERSLRVALVLLHEALRGTRTPTTENIADVSMPSFDAERWGIDGYERIPAYAAFVERVRERMTSVVPPGARIAVVSRGDDHLLRLEERAAEHFPQDKTGRYAGYYPKDARQAIELLRELRWRGTQFVVFPATAFWWFDFYSELARWLAPASVWACDDCAVFELARLLDDGGGTP